MIKICGRLLMLGCLVWGSVRCTTTPLPPVTTDPICVGSETAEAFVVFLHGMDSSDSEGGNRTVRGIFTRLAADLNIRFALPKSRQACPTEPTWRCWGWDFASKELKASVKTIQAAAETCFPKDARFGLIGFSNGGYLLSNLYRNCQMKEHLPQAEFSIAIASGFKKLPRDVANDLRSCGRFKMLNGTRDAANSNQDGSYARLLQSRGGDVEEIMFDGGHTIPEAVLRELLSQVLKDVD